MTSATVQRAANACLPPLVAVRSLKGSRGSRSISSLSGAARTGKYFFLNTLARVDGLFCVSGAMEPCTPGADLSVELLTVNDLEEGDYATSTIAPPASLNSSSSLETPLVGFVDVEGQGDRHSSYDALLATPLLLLSKVVSARNSSSFLLRCGMSNEIYRRSAVVVNTR